ncbi:CNNM domain-containing protein [Streptomyces globosus]|uniref:CNNM domain-containing protein n=1 Tax=Streptomyces globosus TaxID=68209 RepID=UPI003D16922A
MLAFTGQAAEPLAVALVTLLLTFVTLVAGELAPKRLAMQFAQRWSLIAATPLDILATASRPAVWTLSHTTNLLVRILGGDPRAGKQPPTPEELRDMVISHRGLTPSSAPSSPGPWRSANAPCARRSCPAGQCSLLPHRCPPLRPEPRWRTPDPPEPPSWPQAASRMSSAWPTP